MNRMKKMTSLLLTLCMLLSLLPAVSIPAAAADDDENVLSALGFDTGSEPDGYDSGEDASSPYGVPVTTVAPVKELYSIGGNEFDGALLYGNNLKIDATTEELVDSGTYAGFHMNANAYQAVAGNFDGSGLEGQVALLTAVRSGSDGDYTYDLDLTFVDPTKLTTSSGYQQSTRHLMDDVATFANSSVFIDDYEESPVLYQGYLQIAAGDFDGNGIDEIAVYIPYDTNPIVKVFQLQADGTQWQTPSAWKLIKNYALSYDTYAPNQVCLTACDMTGDGIDDLGITWGGLYMDMSYTAGKAVVLRGSKDGDPLQTELPVPISNYEDYGLLGVSMAFGDVDGDGKDNDLVLSGQSIYNLLTGGQGNINPYTRYIAAYAYDSDDESFTPSVETNVDMGSSSYVGHLTMGMGLRTALAVVQKDGIGTQDYVYVDGVLLKLDNFGFSAVQPLYAATDMTACAVYSATAADFNGDGKETVAIMLYNAHPYPENGETTYSMIHCETDLTGLGYFDTYTTLVNYPCALAAPDTDQDTMKMTYTGEHYLVYSDPEILAVVAAPPYFGDLEHLDGGDSYVGNSETTYASSSGSSAGGSASATLTSGGYITVEQELSFLGIKGAQIQAEAELVTHITAEYEKSWERSQTVEYGTTGGQDAVALYSVPVAVYIYDAYVPTQQSDGSIVWTEQTMTINVPYDAAVRTLSVEDYDAIAKNYDDLPTVHGNILDSTPGFPASYPTSTAGYSDVNRYDGSYAGASYGSSGYIKQTLSMTEETSVSASYSTELSLKAGLGIAGVTVGVTAGVEAGVGVVLCDMTGSEFSGTVFGMPEEAAEYGYGYNWSIFEAMYSDGEHTFPVVSYIVNSVIAPPDLPADFRADVEKITSDSITLTWKNSDPSAVGFQLYRHYEFPDGSGDFAVGDVIGADAYVSYDEATEEYSYSYTDEGLESYSEYQYSIQSIGGTSPYYSVLSDMVSAYTAPQTGQPKITLSDKTLLLYPDETVDLSVTVSNDAENAKAPLYQWQKLVDGAWTSLNGENSSALTFTGANTSDAGTYRCRVNQVVGTYYISAYSDRAEVSFSKRTPSAVVTVAKDSDADMTPEITATIANADSGGSIPTGSVTFEIAGSDSVQTVTAELESDGTATVSGWTAPKAGVYSIFASYSGNRVFTSASAKTIIMIGTSSGFWMEDPRNMVYGDSATAKISQYTETDGSITKTALSELTGYTVSYRIYRQDYAGFYIWTLMDEGDDYTISGDTITPIEMGRYKIEATIMEDSSGDTVATLAQDFTVTQRRLTLTAPTSTAPQDEAAQPVADDLTVSGGSLAFSETLSSLGLGVECLNSAGTAVTISSAISPGVYTTRVTADPNYSTAQANYDFTFVNGTYAVTGLTYPVTVSAHTLMGKTVGSINVLSPKDYTNGAEYQYGTPLLFEADPDSGYEVKSWTVTVGTETEEVDPDTLTNPNMLTMTMKDEAIDVVVTFQVRDTTLTFGGTNGSVVCVDSDLLESGANVIAGASYTFKAIPDEGYHFVEWQLYANGFSYPADTEDAEGYHTCTLTIGSVSTELVAIFERDSYTLTLGDNLKASYYWDDDDDSNTDDVQKSVSSGAEITGDTSVTVEPVSGYCIEEDGNWYANGSALTTAEDDPDTDENETVYYSGQNYQFTITQDIEIDADTEVQYYDVTVSTGWTGSGTDLGENLVTVSVNGTETDLDSLTGLAGSSTVSFTAVPAYGSVFDYWVVNETTIDPDTLTDPNIYTCGALGEDLAVTAYFTENTSYTVSGTIEAHGELSYSLNGGEAVDLGSGSGSFSVPVYEGDTLVFTAAPDSEFMVGGWTLDDDWYQTTNKTCTLSDITDDHTLDLSFTAMLYYTLTFSSGANGSLSAVMDGNYTLTSGERPGGGTEICFTATPDSDYMVAGWTVNDETVKTELGTDYVDSVYTIESLSGDNKVCVTFESVQAWTVSLPSTQENYTITAAFSPDDYSFSGNSGSVRDGASAVVRVTPDIGYAIDSVSVSGDTVGEFDDVSVSDDGTWVCTIKSVTEDLTFSAAAESVYTVTVATATGGTAEADVTSCVAGTHVPIKASALENYVFSGWTASGADGGTVVINDDTAAQTYFTMPAENVTVTPSFTYVSSGGGSSGGGSSGGGSSGSGTGSDEDEDEDEYITISNSDGNTVTGTLTETDDGVKADFSRDDFDDLAENSDSPVTIDLWIAEVTFDGKTIDGISGSSDTGDISLTMETVDTSELSDEAQALIGDRLVYDFTLMAGDTQITYLDGTATVSIPYTLSSEENPNAVVIYYIDDSGKLNTVRGRYNAETGTVNFTVTHFSVYAVGYNEVTFFDVAEDDWYYDAVTFCAAREITTGTGDNLFSPDDTLTRGQFIVMLMRAYGIEAEEDATDNFDDAGNTYYTDYLAAAKSLGITNGVGDNLFRPETEITRQDMFTLLYRALDVMEELPEAGDTASLSDFSDANEIADYAEDAMDAFVATGIVSGSNGALDPLGGSTRAQMAQVLYNLLSI